MNIIDISWPLSMTTTEYKNRKSITFETTKTIEKDSVAESMIRFHAHTGTHIDAPCHFLKDGSTVDNIALSRLIGTCRVLDCTQAHNAISQELLESFAIKPQEIILLKTQNSDKDPHEPFDTNFIYLNAQAAQYLVTCNIKSVGIDYLGIERNQPNHETHKILMNNNIPIIEGLRLAQVNPGYYTLVCLPLNIIGLDAAPARAILIEGNALSD